MKRTFNRFVFLKRFFSALQYNSCGDPVKKRKLKKKPFITLLALISLSTAFIARQTIVELTHTTETYANNNKSTTVVLDAGHGGYDSGCVGEDGTLEKTITLDVVLQIGNILEANNLEVIYTRDSDEVSWPEDNTEDLQSRVDIAEEADADLFVSIHVNSSNYNDGAKGYESYTNLENQKLLALATSVHENFNATGYTYDRGIFDSQEYPFYVLINNDVPSILIELGFITDPEDLYTMTHSSNDLAQCIANSILQEYDQ